MGIFPFLTSSKDKGIDRLSLQAVEETEVTLPVGSLKVRESLEVRKWGKGVEP